MIAVTPSVVHYRYKLCMRNVFCYLLQTLMKIFLYEGLNPNCIYILSCQPIINICIYNKWINY